MLIAVFPRAGAAPAGRNAVDPASARSRIPLTDELAEMLDPLAADFPPGPRAVASPIDPRLGLDAASEGPATAAGPTATPAAPSVSAPEPTAQPASDATAFPTMLPTAVSTPAPTPVPTATPTPVAAGPAPDAEQVSSDVVLAPREELLLAAMNAARAEAGLSTLIARGDLTSVARARSEEMIRLDYFAHFHPDGHSAYELLAEAGVTFSAAGENLVKTYGDAEQSVAIGFEALMGSATHRDNILKAVYSRVGVGSFTSADGITIITAIFTDR